jgi:hypothetical protein
MSNYILSILYYIIVYYIIIIVITQFVLKSI